MAILSRLIISVLFACIVPLVSPHALQANEPAVTIAPSKTTGIKVVMHTNTISEKGGINKAVYYVRYLLDHYQRLGIPASQVKMSVVFYGDGVLALFNDQALIERMPKKAKGNRSSKALKELMDAGVSIEACSETMRLRKFKASDLLPGVHMVAGSYVRVIDLQLQGYAYLKM